MLMCVDNVGYAQKTGRVTTLNELAQNLITV